MILSTRILSHDLKFYRKQSMTLVPNHNYPSHLTIVHRRHRWVIAFQECSCSWLRYNGCYTHSNIDEALVHRLNSVFCTLTTTGLTADLLSFYLKPILVFWMFASSLQYFAVEILLAFCCTLSFLSTSWIIFSSHCFSIRRISVIGEIFQFICFPLTKTCIQCWPYRQQDKKNVFNTHSSFQSQSAKTTRPDVCCKLSKTSPTKFFVLAIFFQLHRKTSKQVQWTLFFAACPCYRSFLGFGHF